MELYFVVPDVWSFANDFATVRIINGPVIIENIFGFSSEGVKMRMLYCGKQGRKAMTKFGA